MDFIGSTGSDGSEPVTQIGSPLPFTEGEAKMVKELFGDALDSGKALVHRKKWCIFQGLRTAMAPSGDIYFYLGDFVDDFFQLGIVGRAWFVRKPTHVWQYRQGINLQLGGMMNRSYNYSPLDVDRSFSSYGIEPQASVVADYYRVKNGYSPTQGSTVLNGFQSVIPFGR